MAQQTADRGASRIGAAGIGVGGIIVAAFSRAPWMQVSYFDDRVGGGVRALSGAQWSTEASAVALLLLAAAVAALALRRLPRRIIGAIAAVAAVGAALSPLNLLVSGADPERVRAALDGAADGENVGLGNVDARLRQVYGDEYGLVIETAPGAGTKVSFRVPKFAPSLHQGGATVVR